MRFLCRVATSTGIDRLHQWKRAYKHREGGFFRTRRRCRACRTVQECQLPGGEWRTVALVKRPKARPESTTQAISAIRQDAVEGEL